ncbi:MAG: DNA pilot protein [Microvirus sp.]|nr:MAG: DNA pilot protein [Microvirus sp.]
MGLFSSLGKIASVVGAFVPGPIGTALSVAGSVAGAADANSANKAAAQTQMDFQQYNSNTSYQRAVADMQAAGLNPMLAYSQGGASTPSGSSYSAQDVVTPAAKLGNETTSTNSAVALQKAQIQNTQSSTALNTANVLKAHADANLSSAQAANVAADLPAKDVKSQFFRAMQPRATSAADAVRGFNLKDTIKEGLDKARTINQGTDPNGKNLENLRRLMYTN